MTGQRAHALKFHKRHQATFLGNSEFSSFIKLLGSVTTLEDIERQEIVSKYAGSKYSVTLSNRTFVHLMTYLNGCMNPILLHLLRSKVDLRLSDALGAASKAEGVRRLACEKREERNQVAENREVERRGESSGGEVVPENRNLADLAKRSRDLPPGLPSAKLYSLNRPASCARFSLDGSLVCAGAEDGSLRVWNLNPTAENDESEEAAEGLKPRRKHLNILKRAKETEKTSWTQLELRENVGPVYDAAFVSAPGGRSRYLFASGGDAVIRLFDLEETRLVAEYAGHSYPAWCLDVDKIGVYSISGKEFVQEIFLILYLFYIFYDS